MVRRQVLFIFLVCSIVCHVSSFKLQSAGLFRGLKLGSGRFLPRTIPAASSSAADPSLRSADPDVWSLINKEYGRQFNGIELIASENFVSRPVMQALGSCMTNKYSEGLPNARYYGGNEYIDQMELLCQERALSLFKLDTSKWGVNVQPYSGSPANFAVYTALLKPGDRIMGLDLPSGGHLTHGYQTAKRKVSATSIYFESMPYKVSPSTGLIDYDEVSGLAESFKPKLIIAGASAYPRDWDYARMRSIADSVGAYLMADIAHIAGVVATGQANNPFEHCHAVTTTTHKSLRGPRSGMIFYQNLLGEAVNNAVFPALQGGPHNHQIAAVAVALKEAAEPAFTDYIKQVKLNAAQLARSLQSHGYSLVTNGTDNHLVLWDARGTGLSGSKIEKALEWCDVSANKNAIFGDSSALNPGGVRLGTLAMTTRGMKEADMVHIADMIHRIVQVALKVQTACEQAQCAITTATAPTEGNVCPPHTKTTVKLADFVTQAKEGPHREEFNTLKAEVRKYAGSFPLPGIVP